MSFWQKILSLFSKKAREDKEWAGLDYGKPAKPDNLMPLDPNDPWKT
jgi:hypothetical protein